MPKEIKRKEEVGQRREKYCYEDNIEKTEDDENKTRIMQSAEVGGERLGIK